MNNDLKIIKKEYGEKMSHLCRKDFPTILETKGLLPKILLENFYPTHYLYDDLKEQNKLIQFRSHIYGLVKYELKQEPKLDTGKTPEELMSEAGYNLVECITEEEIQQFKRYYQPEEELCTFQGKRLNTCRVFFAVKKNVNQIKREDFKNPKRQDEYGTSVISIQFTKDPSHILFITNRYNHKVDDYDATFSNNLENIIPGLTKSFEKKYGLIQRYGEKIDLLNYVRDSNGKHYKYNYRINDICYCPNNIIIDNGVVKQLDTESYLVLDYFILDLKNKKIELYDKKLNDAFPNSIKNIEKIEVKKNGENKEIVITTEEGEPVLITVNKWNCITRVKNNNIETAQDNYLHTVVYLEEFIATNLKKAENGFLRYNRKLKHLITPNLEEAGSYFLSDNEELTELNLEKVSKVGDHCVERNKKINKLIAPNLEEVGHLFLYYNEKLTELYLKKIRKIGNGFLVCNKEIIKLIAPNLEEVGDSFMYTNPTLQILFTPKLKKRGNVFLNCHPILNKKFVEEIRERKIV